MNQAIAWLGAVLGLGTIGAVGLVGCLATVEVMQSTILAEAPLLEVLALVVVSIVASSGAHRVLERLISNPGRPCDRDCSRCPVPCAARRRHADR